MAEFDEMYRWDPESRDTRNWLNLGIWHRARRLVEESPNGDLAFPSTEADPTVSMMTAESTDYADLQKTGMSKYGIEVEALDHANLETIQIMEEGTVGGVPPRRPDTVLGASLVDYIGLEGRDLRVARNYHLEEDGRLSEQVTVEPDDTKDYTFFEYPDIGLQGRQMLFDELNGIEAID